MKLRHVGLLLAVVPVLAAVPALATPGSGASGPITGRGVAVDKVVTRGNQPWDAVAQHITIAPGGHTGWHTHPGNAVAIVKAGTLTIYDGDDRSCEGRDYTAGETYIDPGYGHVHIGRNEGTTPLEILVTYLDVPLGGGVRIDAADPADCDF